MKTFLFLSLLVSVQVFAADKEGDLLQPVSDVSHMTRQEQQETPSIEQVEIKRIPAKKADRKILKEKVKHSKPWTSY